ncbi:MAG: guanylate kinase [Kiritimatiellales bacterium]|jgi:guanylate kinase
MSNKHTPLLLVISAPSGAGKSSLCNRLTGKFPEMVYSVSCTTRAPRGSEQNGVHYHFLSDAEFCARIAAGEFLEHALVHGNRYGTLKQTVVDALAQGRDIIMDIDVQGAQQIRRACAAMSDADVIKKSFVDIFIAPPSMEELRRRLCGRSTDSDEVIERRMRNAHEEMKHQSSYQHVVINDDFGKAVNELEKIITREHHNR